MGGGPKFLYFWYKKIFETFRNFCLLCRTDSWNLLINSYEIQNQLVQTMVGNRVRILKSRRLLNIWYKIELLIINKLLTRWIDFLYSAKGCRFCLFFDYSLMMRPSFCLCPETSKFEKNTDWTPNKTMDIHFRYNGEESSSYALNKFNINGLPTPNSRPFGQ